MRYALVKCGVMFYSDRQGHKLSLKGDEPMQSIIYPFKLEGESALRSSRPSEAPRGARASVKEYYPEFLARMLPSRIVEEIRSVTKARRNIVLEEIRLRRDAASSLTTSDGTLVLPVVLTGREMDDTLTRISGGSLYSYNETIGE